MLLVPKILPPVGLFLLFIGLPASGDVQVGDTRAQVFAALEKPTKRIQAEQREVYSFDRGQVILEQGRLKSHHIVFAEVARERPEAARLRGARIEHGQERRDSLLDDPDLAGAFPQARLALWHSFHQRSPERGVSFDKSVAAQQARLARQPKMLDRMPNAARRQLASFYRSSSPRFFGSPVPANGTFLDPNRPLRFQLQPPSARQRHMAFKTRAFSPAGARYVVGSPYSYSYPYSHPIPSPKFHSPVHTAIYPLSRAHRYSSESPSLAHYPDRAR
jgi:hypothetical protein